MTMTPETSTTSTNGTPLTNSKVKTIKVTLTSRGPGLLMNPMTEDILMELAGAGPKAASDKSIPIEDRAKKKIIREDDNPEGRAGIPVTYILAALIYAGRYVKNGKDKISTASTTTLYEFLTIDDEFFPFENQNEHTVDLRRGVLNNKGDKVAVAIIRPKFKHWQISFVISIENIGEDVIKQLFEAAGKKAGIGDFRPSRKGPFGMFSVTGWEVLK